ncbi:MAG: Tetratricopeptide 2 repeat-containing protein [Bacteroidetes bacterium]|nr:Tetratricopeptide 2 repeat-containing protein [Bacteroidota bacterium]
MAKKDTAGKPTNSSSHQPKEQTKKGTQSVSKPGSPGFSYIPYLIIFLFAIGIYANTIGNQQAIDDPIVFTGNKFVQQGFGGIKDIITHDASVGFFGDKANELLSGGRYRPLSLVSFAIEVQLFGNNPGIAHGINILLFALTCLVLFHLLSYLLPQKKGSAFYLSIAFVAAMLFAGHPIHTEAVANIKGRDEIMSLLFSLMALYSAVKYTRENKIRDLIVGGVLFLLALLSKENAITFLAIIPLTYYFFTQARVREYAAMAGAFIAPVLVFLILRSIYTQTGAVTSESTEILNNPFLYLPQGTAGMLQRYATIIMTFLLYYKLLIFPHPLTHDYFYNEIPYVGVSNPWFIVSFVVTIGLLVYAVMGLRKKSLPSYAILFYFITFSIVSNLFINVGSLMTERFVFMGSVGFCLLLAYLLVMAKDRFDLPAQSVPVAIVLLLALYSVKTISRNRDWYDNTTLLITDAQTSTHSAKVLMGVGDNLLIMANANIDSLRQTGHLQRTMDLLEVHVDVATAADTTIRRILLEKAEDHMKRSLTIYPGRGPAWLMLGTTAYKLYRPAAEVISYYARADSLKPGGDYESRYNIGCIYIDQNQLVQAKNGFLKALEADPKQLPSTFNLAVMYMKLNMIDSSIWWFNRSMELNPGEPAIYNNLAAIYKQQGDTPKAEEYAARARQLAGGH